MATYTPTIGLEIHAELKTRTKMFCDCRNDPNEERPNVNICPICLGHPGTLPVINKEAVQHILKVGKAIGGKLADITEFDRKNYFYPDIPKGYQISQYKRPLVSGGELAGVKITRVHLEEDTGTSSHEDKEYSLVNFNRAGVPLMELVTEPVIHGTAEAVRFAKELQLLIQYLSIGEANMEKGEMRLEANVSVSSGNKLGTKVEIKNLNSFKAAQKAIEYEVKRQSTLLDRGEKVVQETRGWNEKKEATFSQRQKEESHDYRYFPDPDLPKLDLTKLDFDLGVGETPKEKRKRFSAYGIKNSDVEFFVNNIHFANFAEKIFRNDHKFNQLASNYIVSDLASFDAAKTINPKYFLELIEMIMEAQISSRAAKDILPLLLNGKRGPHEITEEKKLIQKSDTAAVEKIALKIISDNPKIVSDYKMGKTAALQYLVGQGMKMSGGSTNPTVLRNILEEKLNER